MSTPKSTDISGQQLYKQYMEQEEQKLKERTFLRLFNQNFDVFKDYAKEIFKQRDEDEIRKLNDIAQPKIIYNNFPFVLGILFFIFGILLISSGIDYKSVTAALTKTTIETTNK
jgi:hypothetical protein